MDAFLEEANEVIENSKRLESDLASAQEKVERHENFLKIVKLRLDTRKELFNLVNKWFPEKK